MNAPESVSQPYEVQGFAAMLGDLIATHESSPGPEHRPQPADAPSRLPARTTRINESGPRSLFGEILDFMLAPLLVLWPLTIVITLIFSRSLADAPYDASLSDRTQSLSQQVKFELTNAGAIASVADGTRELFSREAGSLFYQVVSPDDQTLFGDPTLPRPSLYDYPELGQVSFRNITHRDRDLRVAYTYVPVRGQEDLTRPVLVQVAEPFVQRRDLANRMIKGVIFPQFIIVPLAAALVWFGLSRGLRPLRGLRDRIRDRRPDDLSPIDPTSAPQEIVPLVESFNELLTQLETTLATQRRFIADAAHQMKTPLAGIRMQAELALREPEPAERQRSLTQLARSSGRASHLINQLLALARAESLGEKTGFDRLELNALLREVITELAPMALDAGLDLGFEDTDSPVVVFGSPVLLGELIQNLVSNAIHYTPRGGVVNIRVRTGMGVATVEIEDNGPGIPVPERETVFERFYRLRDRVATNEGEARGSGLGLAIVREIARLHQGSVEITDGAPWPASRGRGYGANFVLRLPLATA